MKWLQIFNLGSIDPPKQILSTYIEVKRNEDNLLNLTCPGQSLHSDLIDFGIAEKNNTIVGLGLNARVKTITGCSFGEISDVRKEWAFMNKYTD